jgi:HlyD family secretion protein
MARATLAPHPRRGWSISSSLLGTLAVLVLVAAILAMTGTLAQLVAIVTGQSGTATSYSTTTVSRGNLTVSVTGTGPITANINVPLSFKESGKLTAIKVNVGDKVTKGQVLATLDTPDLQIALEQAKASLAQSQANLSKVQAGATNVAIAVAQTSVANAKRSTADAQDALTWTQTTNTKDATAAQASVASAQGSLETARSAVTAAQDQQTNNLAADQLAITSAQKNLDAVKANIAAQLPVLQQQVAQAKNSLWSAQISRDAACGQNSHGTACQSGNASVVAAQSSLDTANAQAIYSQKQSEQQIAAAQATVDADQAQLAKDQASLNATVVSAQNQVRQAELAVSAARASLDQTQAKAGQSLQSAQAQVDSATNALQSAQASYNQTVAPPLQSDRDAAKAQVATAQAAVDQAQLNLDDATLVAPFDGTIAAVNGSLQQWVTGGAPGITSTSGGSTASATAIVTLFDLNSLQVTVQVNEADIGKVAVGDPVSFTLNAFPTQKFSGKVLTIQPAGTTTSNVVSYNVTCSISSGNGMSLYPGMTATATIVTTERQNVLLIPNTAVSFAQTALTQGLIATPTPIASPTTQATTGTTTGTESLVVTSSGSKLLAKAVTLGVVGNTRTEVLSGVNAGDTIVVGQAAAQAGGSQRSRALFGFGG